MKKILIITWNYPYYPGEQFLETEIEFWGNNEGVDIIILPSNTRGEPREIPQNIKLIKIFNQRNDFFFIIFQFFFQRFYILK